MVVKGSIDGKVGLFEAYAVNSASQHQNCRHFKRSRYSSCSPEYSEEKSRHDSEPYQHPYHQLVFLLDNICHFGLGGEVLNVQEYLARTVIHPELGEQRRCDRFAVLVRLCISLTWSVGL